MSLDIHNSMCRCVETWYMTVKYYAAVENNELWLTEQSIKVNQVREVEQSLSNNIIIQIQSKHMEDNTSVFKTTFSVHV